MSNEKITARLGAAALALIAVLASGCGVFEETPEEAASRIARQREAARQAALPVSEASCRDLTRRIDDAEAVITEHLRRRDALAACRTTGIGPLGLPVVPGSCALAIPEPRSTAREEALVATIVAEQARRCPN